MEYAVERYYRDGRSVPQQNQNGRPHSYHDYAAPYERQTSYPGKLPISGQIYPPKVSPRGNFREHQNAHAITNYNVDRSKVREGRQAAAVAQMYQNDLHNINRMKELPQTRENGMANGLVVATPDKSKSYIKQHLNLQTKLSRAQTDSRQQSTGRTQNGHQDSDLSTSFDPIRDRHMWTMWRTAVNGRIVDEVRQLERIKNERPPTPSSAIDSLVPGMYGKALVVPPLKRFIKFDEESRAIATQMSNVGQGRLETSQFVYYGLPRVYVSPYRK